MVPPASHRVSRAPCYSGTPTRNFSFRLQDYHLLWSDFPDRSTNCHSGNVGARNPREQAPWFGLIRFRSPLLTESRLISVPAGTKMFQFPAFAPDGLYIQPPVTSSGCPVTSGCPIRRSRDYRLLDTCPGLIAVCHVLHRLSTPRHPPYTLSNLTISIDD